MAIEVEEKKLLKHELVNVINDIFISTEEISDKHMDFSHIDGVLFVKEKEKKIPFFKFKQLKDRFLLRKDFSDFLKSFHIKEDEDGNQFVMATVFLGMSSGHSRSFYVSDYKIIVPMVKKFVKDNNTIALVVSHFSEKTSSNGNGIEHIHILYRNVVGKNKIPFIGEYLEENYEED